MFELHTLRFCTNLGTVEPLHKANLGYPGCWAYPDMLQVGCKHGQGCCRSRPFSRETRSHFGSWAIVSSPLTLSHDVWNTTISDEIWDVIANTEVLEVNQAYVGDSGGVYDSSEKQVTLTDSVIEADDSMDEVTAPASQFLYKPIGNGRVAILLMNSDSSTQTLTTDFKVFLELRVANVTFEIFGGTKTWVNLILLFSSTVASHDAGFFVVSSA